MGAGAVRPAFEQGWPAAGSRPPDRLFRHLIDAEDVIPIQRDARHAVARRLRRNIRVPRHSGEWYFGRVLVVLADEEDGQIPDGGEVQPLVEGAVVDRAIPEEGNG